MERPNPILFFVITLGINQQPSLVFLQLNPKFPLTAKAKAMNLLIFMSHDWLFRTTNHK